MALAHVAIVGLGLIGSSIARAARERLPQVTVTGHDASADVRAEARALGFCDSVADDPAAAVAGADLVILAVPVGCMAEAAAALAPGLRADAIISDVGSSKSGVAEALAKALPDRLVIPAHPVAGTENSGPAAGFASLFEGRWCIVTPPAGAPADAVAAFRDILEDRRLAELGHDEDPDADHSAWPWPRPGQPSPGQPAGAPRWQPRAMACGHGTA